MKTIDIKKIVTYRTLTLVALLVLSMIFVPRFSNPMNLINVLRNAFLLMALGYAMSLSMLIAGIDLSIGSTAALSTVLGATFISQGNVFLGVLVTMAVGGCIGLINGFVIGRLKLPDFIMTFSMMYIARGLALTYTQGLSFYNFPASFKWLGKGSVGFLPAPVLISVIMLVLLHIMLNKTTFGRKIYAVGVNKKAAQYTGIDVGKTIMKVYALSGIIVSFAGLIFIARLNSADAELGQNWPLEAIAVCVIGGVTFEGGEGNILGLIIGGIVMAVISNCINLIGIPSRFQDFFVGFVIILVVTIDNLSKRRKIPALETGN